MAATMAATPPVKIFRHDAMNATPVNMSQANTHCVVTLGKTDPTHEEMHSAFIVLAALQKAIAANGEAEIKSYLLKAAARRGIKHMGNPISSWSSLTNEWRDKPTLRLCKDLYEIMVTDFNEASRVWYAEKEALCKQRLDFEIVNMSEQQPGGSFVHLVLKKCHANVWKTFNSGRKVSHTVSLTQKREKRHPMGEPVPRTKTDVFCFQNVRGWEELCQLDPVANAIWQKKKEAGDGFFDQDVGRALILYVDDDDEDSVEDVRRSSARAAATIRTEGTRTPTSTLTKTGFGQVNEGGNGGIETVVPPTSVLTEKDSQLRAMQSPAGVSMSRASEINPSPFRNSVFGISAADRSKNKDIVPASTLVHQVGMTKRVTRTAGFEDLSTMFGSCITEVKGWGGGA